MKSQPPGNYGLKTCANLKTESWPNLAPSRKPKILQILPPIISFKTTTSTSQKTYKNMTFNHNPGELMAPPYSHLSSLLSAPAASTTDDAVFVFDSRWSISQDQRKQLIIKMAAHGVLCWDHHALHAMVACDAPSLLLQCIHNKDQSINQELFTSHALFRACCS